MRVGLVARHVNGFNAWQFNVGASSPMAVLVGGVIATYATTGNTGVALSFPIVGVALWFLMAGYRNMTYRKGNAAPGYAFMALGLGPSWGIASGAVAFAAYNAIQISLYPLVGSTVAGTTGVFGWMVWAWLAWAGIAVFGVANFSLSKIFVAIVGMAEITAILALIVAAFTHPYHGHVSAEPMTIGALWNRRAQIGGVFALSGAAYVGVETSAVYAEEGITDKTVVRATVGALLFLPVFYTLIAWALPVWSGPGQIVDAAQNAAKTGFPLTIIQVYYGDLAFHGAQILMVTSMFISALAFHNVVGRYVHAIAREGVLPIGLARVGLLTGRFAGATAPASVLQSGIAAVVLAVFMALRADPIQDMFVWLSSGATVGILLMLIGTSVSTVAFHRKGGGARRENVLIRTALPILGAVIGCVLVLTIISNQSTLLGVTKAWQQWVIPAAVVVTVVAGFGYASLVKARKPAVYAAVGQGRPDVVDDPDMQVGGIRV